MTSHATAILGSCHLIHGQIRRGYELTREDKKQLAIAREYIEAFLEGKKAVPADCHDDAMEKVA